MQISLVQVAECRIALPRVLRLGAIEITTRDYVVVRVETKSGEVGEAIAYSRGTPLFETACSIASRILGADASMRRGIMLGLESSNVPGRAGQTRGLSLFDIALWDIAAKQAELPLYRLLGGFRKKAETTVVAGYYMDSRAISDIVDEAKRLSDEGYRRVKIMLKGNDPAFDLACMKALTGPVPGQIAADAHWSWTTLTEAKRLCRELDQLGLNFLEDPFSAADCRLTVELGREITTPLAAGEDVYGSRSMLDLVNGIDILRVDATTCGGITGAIEAINIATAAGRTVLPHVFPTMHVHLACAFPNVEGVEVIPDQSQADPINTLLQRKPTVQDGELTVSEEPGVGISLNWAAIEGAALRTAAFSMDAHGT